VNRAHEGLFDKAQLIRNVAKRVGRAFEQRYFALVVGRDWRSLARLRGYFSNQKDFFRKPKIARKMSQFRNQVKPQNCV
jgi:hypothetical protein